MTENDYKAVLDNAMVKLRTLLAQREETDVQISKLRQFIHATINMLPDNERESFTEQVNIVSQKIERRDAGLTDAIREVLQETGVRWLTAAEVRDRLSLLGFDFSDYTANPLASVSTTLRRMKPGEVETTMVSGVTAYRWKRKPIAQVPVRQRAFAGVPAPSPSLAGVPPPKPTGK
jgi:hypothetical protein